MLILQNKPKLRAGDLWEDRGIEPGTRTPTLYPDAAEIAVDVKNDLSIAAKPINPVLSLDDLEGSFCDHEREQIERAFGSVSVFWELTDPDNTEVLDSKDVKALYEYLFPNPDEVENWDDDIVPRIQEMRNLPNSSELQEKYGDSRFHVVVGHHNGDVVACTQFSTMPLKDQVVVFWQYGGVADKKFMSEHYGKDGNYRALGIARALYALRHRLAAQDAKEMGYEKGVAGTILESEMIGQGETDDDIRFTARRLNIHRQMGAKAIMLKMPHGILQTAHLQPRLSADSNPIQLLMLFRPLNYNPQKSKEPEVMDKKLAKELVMAYVDNFDREGFDAGDVAEARRILISRFDEAVEVVMLPPEQIPDITELAKHDDLLKAQVERDYGDIEAHSRKVKAALSGPTEIGARTLGS